MASAQALTEAGLSLEYQDGGSRLIVRDAQPDGCLIRNRGGEALANLLKGNRKIRSLDIRESKISDNGVAHLSLVLRQTDQLEELLLSPVGRSGLELLLGVVRRCERLRCLSLEVVDVPTLHAGRQTMGPGAEKPCLPVKKEKPGEDEEGEEEDAAGDEDEEEEGAENEAEKLKKIWAENDYDSDEEGKSGDKPAKEEAGEDKGTSPALQKLLSDLLSAAKRKENLTSLECAGASVPADLKLDMKRTMEEHVEMRIRKEQKRSQKGDRTAQDALKDQMEELSRGLKAEDAATLPGEEAGTTRLGMRSYVGHRLFAALGEALFECQRYKSKENEALSTAEGEMAFVAMHLRKQAKALKH